MPGYIIEDQLLGGKISYEDIHFMEMEALSREYGGTYSEWNDEDGEAVEAYLAILSGRRKMEKEEHERAKTASRNR